MLCEGNIMRSKTKFTSFIHRILFSIPHYVLLLNFKYLSFGKTSNLLQTITEKEETILSSFTISVALLRTTGHILTTVGGEDRYRFLFESSEPY